MDKGKLINSLTLLSTILDAPVVTKYFPSPRASISVFLQLEAIIRGMHDLYIAMGEQIIMEWQRRDLVGKVVVVAEVAYPTR